MTGASSVCGARRSFLAGAAAAAAWAPIAAMAQSARIYSMLVWRDPGCGCCGAWSVAMQRSGRFATTLRNAPDMDAVKRRLGVPSDLASCHTAEVDGLVIEGHVPIADVLRLLTERPDGVRGIAVPGMPIGSLGMEAPGGARLSMFSRFAAAARPAFSPTIQNATKLARGLCDLRSEGRQTRTESASPH